MLTFNFRNLINRSLLALICLMVTVIAKSASAGAPVQDVTSVTTSDHVKLWVKRSGTNKPVCIFIHGGPGMWSRSFEDLHGNQLESLFSMVYYDQRGSGRSDTAADYSLMRMAKDVDEIRKQMNAEKVYVLSHSFGGIIAYEYARLFPQHLKGLILLNSTLDLNNSIVSQISYIRQLTGAKLTVPAETDPALFSYFGQARRVVDSLKLGYKMLSDDKRSTDTLDAVDSKKPANYGFGNAVWGLPEYTKDLTPGTSAIKVPVLVISGAKDHAVGPEHYKKFRFPNQQVVEINGGHLLYYENTAEMLSAIRKWAKPEPTKLSSRS